MADFRTNDIVLFVGVSTREDLPFRSDKIYVVAVDITEEDEINPQLWHAMNRVSSIIATWLIVRFEDLFEGQPITVPRNIPSDFLSRSRVILMVKD